jgi:hypothetical protein
MLHAQFEFAYSLKVIESASNCARPLAPGKGEFNIL